jgi:predicted nucleic acid-binding Zn ribbon protein
MKKDKKENQTTTEERIEMPVYFYIDEETGEKHYDFEEMANELENRICKKLNRNVLITLSEV